MASGDPNIQNVSSPIQLVFSFYVRRIGIGTAVHNLIVFAHSHAAQLLHSLSLSLVMPNSVQNNTQTHFSNSSNDFVCSFIFGVVRVRYLSLDWNFWDQSNSIIFRPSWLFSSKRTHLLMPLKKAAIITKTKLMQWKVGSRLWLCSEIFTQRWFKIFLESANCSNAKTRVCRLGRLFYTLMHLSVFSEKRNSRVHGNFASNAEPWFGSLVKWFFHCFRTWKKYFLRHVPKKLRMCFQF